MNRDSFLQIHGIDAEAWAEKHGIEPFDAICPSCESPVRLSIPIMRKGSPGLMAEECECGTYNRPYCFLVNWEGR